MTVAVRIDVSGTISRRRLAAMLLGSMRRGEQAELSRTLGMTESNISRALKHPDVNVPSFDRVAAHYGFEAAMTPSFYRGKP